MPFSEDTKLIVKQKADFKCCVCHTIWVEVHHILPQADGGPDTEDNAAPLCPTCHELYGANPMKRKFIRESRDHWYRVCEKRYAPDTELAQKLAKLIVKELLEFSALRSMVTTANPLPRCFISFVESDDVFAEKLYNDLKTAGIKCWRWRDDAPLIFDKIIAICSEESLNSPTVIRDIEHALVEENYLARRGKKNAVLFPICLDGYIFRKWIHPQKENVLARNVSDFRHWGEPDVYHNALNHFIDALKL